MNAKPLIKLWDAGGIGVIIEYPSGVCYSNQVGGTACLHPAIEGVYVPLVDKDVDQEKQLFDYFVDPKRLWNRPDVARDVNADDADFVDSILHARYHTRIIRVDRSRLHESHEAWVYVEITAQPADQALHGSSAGSETMRGFGTCKGVLTWANSD
ncbi:MAG: hypothetical protein KC496_00620 [Anaerolineae bacterium]|nr:hypothetical protein [Anaerolineae bacterium]